MKIALTVNFKKIKNRAELLRLCTKLREISSEIFVEQDFYKEYKQIGDWFTYTDLDSAMKKSDIAVVIGGDGTVIHTAKSAAKHSLPVLAINSGRIGYLTDLEMDDINFLDRLKSGDYIKEKRMMLDVKISSSGRVFTALNDIVVSRGTLSRMLDFSISCNGGNSIKYRADGIIFATPTGSSAYSLSAGGPLLDPSVNTMLVTPICPHSLFARTIMFDASNVLKLSLFSQKYKETYITVDGEDAIKLDENDFVTLKKSDISAEFIRIKNEQFYDIISKKMIEKGI